MARKRQFRATYSASVCEVFTALSVTLAFRRWGTSDELPPAGFRYRRQAGSALRVGRIVDVIRPCGLTLQEVLHDPPCRVSLFLRWRIEPTLAGSSVRLDATYRLNHAAALRFGHWERRLRLHFDRQLKFIGANLLRLRDSEALIYARNRL